MAWLDMASCGMGWLGIVGCGVTWWDVVDGTCWHLAWHGKMWQNKVWLGMDEVAGVI